MFYSIDVAVAVVVCACINPADEVQIIFTVHKTTGHAFGQSITKQEYQRCSLSWPGHVIIGYNIIWLADYNTIHNCLLETQAAFFEFALQRLNLWVLGAISIM